MGKSGAGQLTKMANQVYIAGLVLALAERLTLAKNYELNLNHVVEVISQRAALSWQMENRAKIML